MGLFSKKENTNKFKELVKEKKKQDKQIEKEWAERVNNKYAAENLKAAKGMMLENAMKIDTLEYEKIANELKERLNKKEQ